MAVYATSNNASNEVVILTIGSVVLSIRFDLQNDASVAHLPGDR